MYTRILAPLDGSSLAERILPYTRRLAEAYGAPVELLWVSDPTVRTPFYPPLPSRSYLREVAAAYLPSLRVQYSEVTGNPAAIIIERAEADPGCLIAMATHGLSGLRRWFLGSVSSKVVQATRSPLFLMRPAETRDPAVQIRIDTVIVPLDGSPFAERILPHAVALARRMNLEVQLLRAAGPAAYDQAGAESRNGPCIEDDAGTGAAETRTYIESCKQRLQAQGLSRVVGSSVRGDATEEIVKLAARLPHSIVAMATHGRSGFSGRILGSVTENVIQSSKAPVLLIKPRWDRGFSHAIHDR